MTLIPSIPTIHLYLLTRERGKLPSLSLLTKLLPTALCAIIISRGLVGISWQRHLRAPKPDCYLSPGMSCCALSFFLSLSLSLCLSLSLSLSGWIVWPQPASLTLRHTTWLCSSRFLPSPELLSLALSVFSLIFLAFRCSALYMFHVCECCHRCISALDAS